jgi:hypothetical protein
VDKWRKIRFSLKTSKQTYGSKCHNGHTVQSVTGNFIFTSHPIAPVSLFYSCFSINRTNDKSFLNIRGYEVSKKLY